MPRAQIVSLVNGDPSGPYGFYEWHEGVLKSAGILPDGSPHPGETDPYGAEPAATGSERNVEPGMSSANEVSKDGTKAFFVSPDPGYAIADGHPTELYVREQHEKEGREPTTMLVSRNELDGGKEAPGTGDAEAVIPLGGVEHPSEPYVYATPDGSHALFESKDKLARSSTGEEPTGTGPWTYDFNLETEKLTWLPGVVGPILSSSEDGSSFIFDNTSTEKIELSTGGSAPVGVADFSGSSMFAIPRAAKDGEVFTFATSAVLSGPNVLNAQGTEPANNGAGITQIYRYDVSSGKLLCVSCAPSGIAQSSVVFKGDERVLGDEGSQVFFTTGEQLLSQDPNGVDDAYEWEQVGVGSCPAGRAEGCVYLISSGTSPEPSFYLGNSESGEHVFFATLQGLVKSDTDESYDVYDARVNGGFQQTSTQAGCSS